MSTRQPASSQGLRCLTCHTCHTCKLASQHPHRALRLTLPRATRLKRSEFHARHACAHASLLSRLCVPLHVHLLPTCSHQAQRRANFATGTADSTRAPIHLCTYAPMHLYTYAPMHLYTYAPMYLYTYTPIHLCTYTPIHLYTYVPMHLYTYAPIHLCT